MASKKQFQVNPAYHRMNYLYQLMNVFSKKKDVSSGKIVSNCGKLLVGIGKKTQSRMEPAIKRTLCKGCNKLLIPGETAIVRVRKKPSPCVVWTCRECRSLRRFNHRPNHTLWANKPEAVVSVMRQTQTENATKNEVEKKLISTVTIENVNVGKPNDIESSEAKQ
ncbi:hypothetical protein LSTR_LSTR009896 [Laodelphax striatellus]|uniref:Uncharacterized protein n=1 Tax=Laodelphax striatellus TaxID=195883 RepID=A0A482WKW3_LAOST|nr:hypothetical protein LSTR_LSTR009896 [Laodelphax striatellus]